MNTRTVKWGSNSIIDIKIKEGASIIPGNIYNPENGKLKGPSIEDIAKGLLTKVSSGVGQKAISSIFGSSSTSSSSGGGQAKQNTSFSFGTSKANDEGAPNGIGQSDPHPLNVNVGDGK